MHIDYTHIVLDTSLWDESVIYYDLMLTAILFLVHNQLWCEYEYQLGKTMF